SRGLSNRGRVIVRGRFAPIVGRVCMDQCMIDVGNVPDVSVGDEVIIFGHSKDVSWSAEDLANQLGTISYEVMCAVARRVPRVYLRGGETVKIKNLLLR
ncbi:MAG: alanine racemase C-terminal domain-containing protein, partial [Bacillota bacterium]